MTFQKKVNHERNSDKSIFCAVIKNVDEWKSVLEAIGTLVEDAMFICNIDSMTFRGIDQSHVSLLDITFPRSSFEFYESETTYFAVRIDDLKNVINIAHDGDSIEIRMINHNIMHLLINDKLQTEFNLRLLDQKEVNIPIPSIEHTAQIEIEPHLFNEILNKVKTISETISIHCKFDVLAFLGKSEIGDVKIELKNNPNMKIIQSSLDTHAVYNINYLWNMIHSLARTSNNIKLEYASKNPIHMEFEMSSGTKIAYYLAPRME